MRPLPCGLAHYDTPSFISWYHEAAGIGRPPDVYTLWCAISLVAAALVDRVWLERRNRPSLYPNLFTMLVGPSGTGKDTAIERATTLVRSLHDAEQDRIRIFEGKTTAQALLDHFSDTKSITPLGSYFVWLVTPEVRMQIGHGSKAEDFVSHTTELYKTGVPFMDRTRYHGYLSIDKYCLNWTAGSTIEWLIKSVGLDAIYSGFFARICAINAQPRKNTPTRTIYPANKAGIDPWLQHYLQELTYMEGAMIVAPDAERCLVEWDQALQARLDDGSTIDPRMAGFWRHCFTMAEKVAMVMAASDQYSRVIKPRHVDDATRLVDWVGNQLPEILDAASTSPDRLDDDFIRQWMRNNASKEPADHSTALRAASHRGIKKDRFRDLVGQLVEAGELSRETAGGRKTYYKWLAKRTAS